MRNVKQFMLSAQIKGAPGKSIDDHIDELFDRNFEMNFQSFSQYFLKNKTSPLLTWLHPIATKLTSGPSEEIINMERKLDPSNIRKNISVSKKIDTSNNVQWTFFFLKCFYCRLHLEAHTFSR